MEVGKTNRHSLPPISRFLVSNVRMDMNTQGFALVDTSHFLKDKVWPSQRSKDFRKLNDSPSGYYMFLRECQTNWVRQLIQWQGRLLKKALSDEKLCSKGESLSLRNERFRDDSSCKWHLDGYHIRSICTLKGPPTLIMTELGESPIPLGWTLFITARDRTDSVKIPATWHRRPRIKKLRRLIVYGWRSENESEQDQFYCQ